LLFVVIFYFDYGTLVNTFEFQYAAPLGNPADDVGNVSMKLPLNDWVMFDPANVMVIPCVPAALLMLNNGEYVPIAAEPLEYSCNVISVELPPALNSLLVPDVPVNPSVRFAVDGINNPEATALVPSDFISSFAAALLVTPPDDGLHTTPPAPSLDNTSPVV
jgi:hypothetical protein